MKAEPPPLRVASPCPKDWEGMSGDAKRRFCEHCQLHVHNLSAMSQEERERFLEESAGRACITYELRRDGTMVTPSFWRGVLHPFQRLHFAAIAVLATLLPFLFTSCASRRLVGEAWPKPEGGFKKGCQVEKTHAVLLGRPAPPAASHEQAPR